MRTATINRITKETNINIALNLDKSNDSMIDTPVPFLNHMLEAFAFYAGISLSITASGDMEIDDHHTVEDIGITLGQVFQKALENNKDINRYGGYYIPMDEALSRVVLDFSNRPYLVFDVSFTNEKVGNFTLQNTIEFFRAFSSEAKVTLHITNLYGSNDHHIIESVFKAFGKAIKEAISKTDYLQSTKGVI